MSAKIKLNSFDELKMPTLVLMTKSGEKIGVVKAYDFIFKDCLNDCSEISFSVSKEENGVKNNLWDDITDFKNIWIKEYKMWFEITVDISEENEVVKNVSGKSLFESELSQIELYNIEINTEDDIAREDYKEPTVLWNTDKKEISLLNRLMEKAPHYQVIHVDNTIKNIQRTFEFDDVSLYDAFQKIAEEINCIFIFGNSIDDDLGGIPRTISVYDLESNCIDCGHRGEFEGNCPKCNSDNIKEGYGNDTNIFVSSDILGDKIKLKTDVKAVKNCFKIEGGDDLINSAIRNCNPNGTEYIWHITDEVKNDMPKELRDKLEEYDEEYKQWNEEKEITLTPTLTRYYNNIVYKYREYLTDKVEQSFCYDCGEMGYFTEQYGEMLCPNCNSSHIYKGKSISDLDIPDSFKGYSKLMQSYYNAVDIGLFLQSELSPIIDTQKSTTAISELKKLESSLKRENYISVQSLKYLNLSSVENALLTYMKSIINTSYKIESYKTLINNISYPYLVAYGENNRQLSGNYDQDSIKYYKWYGLFKIYNKNNDTDYAISNTVLSVVVTDDQERYYNQKISKIFSDANTEDLSIVTLFSKDNNNIVDIDESLTEFEVELTKYNYDDLEQIYNVCQGVLDVLIEENSKDLGNKQTNFYQKYYQPYKNKLNSISKEMKVRMEQINHISSLQNEIILKNNEIHNALNFEDYLGKDLWNIFSAYRREDKYKNNNYISDGLSNSEIVKRAMELYEVAAEELYKSAELQHSISSQLKNLLSLPQFQNLVDKFEIGNWLRVKVDDDVYKLRLVEYEIDYEKLENISVEFSDVKKTAYGLSDLKSVVEQASKMTTSYDSVKRQASQGSDVKKNISAWVSKGLALTNTMITNSDNQDIIWDKNGILCRKYDYITESYDYEQLKIINKGLYYTGDGWETVSAAIGDFIYYDPLEKKEKEGYGVIADTLIGNFILGEHLGIYSPHGTDISIDDNGIKVSNDRFITNEYSEISDNHKAIKVEINPNNSNGVFRIGTEDLGTSLFKVTNSGQLIIGNVPTTEYNATDKLIIGGNKASFVIDANGDVSLNNLILKGNITWDTDSNPLKVLYARTALSKPTQKYSEYSDAVTNEWHKNYSKDNDYYTSYSYDDGKTWTDAIKTYAKDGEDGSDANIPGYIKSTYIDFSRIESPKIEGNFIIGGQVSGGKFYGGEYYDSNSTAYLTLSYTGGNGNSFADLSYKRKKDNTTLFGICDGIDGASLHLFGCNIGNSGGNQFNANGVWNFSQATVNGLKITFG